MDDSDGAEKFGGLEAEGHEAALEHVFAHDAFRHDADADAVGDGLFDHFDVVEAEDGFDGNAVVF